MAGVVHRYLDFGQNQNVIPESGSLEELLEGDVVQKYFNNYDRLVLANDTMTLLFGVSRSVGFFVLVLFVGYALTEPGFDPKAIATMLLAFYLTANGAISLVSVGTNMLRFFPQVVLVRRLFDIIEPDDEEGVERVGAADIEANPQAKLIAIHLPGGATASSINKLKNALAEDPHALPEPVKSALDSPVYMGEAFTCIGVDVATALGGSSVATDGRGKSDIEALLTRMELQSLLDKLPDGLETVITPEIWAGLDGRERSIFRLSALIVRAPSTASSSRGAIIAFDALNAFSAKIQEAYVEALQYSSVFINIRNAVPKLLEFEGLVRFKGNGDLEWVPEPSPEDLTPASPQPISPVDQSDDPAFMV